MNCCKREKTNVVTCFAGFVLSSIQNLQFCPPGGVANWEWAVWAGELWGNATGRGFSSVLYGVCRENRNYIFRQKKQNGDETSPKM